MIIDRKSCMCGGTMYSEDWDDWKCNRCGHTEEYVCEFCGSYDLQDFWDEDGHLGTCMDCGNYWNLIERETKETE